MPGIDQKAQVHFHLRLPVLAGLFLLSDRQFWHSLLNSLRKILQVPLSFIFKCFSAKPTAKPMQISVSMFYCQVIFIYIDIYMCY
jgi:hypothetical protein